MEKNKQKLVVLTGAGISAESGVKTFRDHDGLWENHRIEDVATATAWRRNPQLVLDFYNARRAQAHSVAPNAAHYGLAELEKDYDVRIITQNVDNLHERAGSTHVLHLHGSLFLMRSDRHPHNDEIAVPFEKDIAMGDLAPDGGQYRPHIVWFEEAVPAIEEAVPIVQQADIFAVIGTSLQVYPAAGLIDYVQPRRPIYVIDRVIPEIPYGREVISIEKPATAGVRELMELLR